MGVKETPIVLELESVLARPHGDVIMIDDARCFGTSPDYPTLEAFRDLVHERRPDLVFDLKGDIIKFS